MKKILLAVLMAMPLFGCGGNDGKYAGEWSDGFSSFTLESSGDHYIERSESAMYGPITIELFEKDGFLVREREDGTHRRTYKILDIDNLIVPIMGMKYTRVTKADEQP